MLTAEQIAGLTGRELDAAVAEHVMGWDASSPDWPEAKVLVSNYSTDIAAAMLVLCKARGERPLDFSIGNRPLLGGYQCFLMLRDGTIAAGSGVYIADAICRAALMATTAKP